MEKNLSLPVFTVSELSFSLKKNIESLYSSIQVRGEISGLKKHTSGHLYYTLKDDQGVLDAVSWRGTYKNTIPLEEGLEIIARGRLTTYPQRSKYQFIVESYEATGQGTLLKLLEDRKKKLASEGLFDGSRKKQIPPFPKVIGVITSPTGAVIQDILHRIRHRFPCHVLIWPVLVQGDEAAQQITKAIQGFQEFTPRPDILIVARGGGSLEDLWAFNEEIVVRAAACSSIPLISAVGHETDTTLIDYAADLRAPTPTAAAEFAVPVLSDLWSYMIDRHKRICDLTLSFLEKKHLHLKVFEKGLITPSQFIDDRQLHLDDLQDRLTSLLFSNYHHTKDRWNALSSRVRPPKDILIHLQNAYHVQTNLLFLHFSRFLENQEQKLKEISVKLDQSSFQKILKKGFSLVTDGKNRPITTVHTFPKNQEVTLILTDGFVKVIKVPSEPKKRNESLKSLPQPKLF